MSTTTTSSHGTDRADRAELAGDQPGIADPPAPEEDPAREALIREPGLVDAPGDGARPAESPAQPTPDPDAPGRGVEETDDPIPEPNEPA